MSESVSFEIHDVPDSLPPIQSDDLTCEVCGTPLSYAGRGRKPRFCAEHKPGSSSRSSSPRRSGKDVDTAMSALSGSHTALQFAMTLVSPKAGQVFEISRHDLDERNRAILESDPALAKRIANAASKGGTAALVISHLIAIGPALAIAAGEVKAENEKRRRRAEAEAAAQADATDGNVFPL